MSGNDCFPNATFAPQGDPASLFSFTSSGFLQDFSLPTNWIAKWQNFFDMRGLADVANTSGNAPQMAQAIDPFLSSGMGNIPTPPGMPNINLASANLRRSGLRGIPCGQDVSGAMHTIKVLTPAQLKKNLTPELAAAVKKHGLDIKTPLWFYILQEANALHKGQHLGEMGSTLVAETFMTLVRSSRTSIVQDKWTPNQSPLRANINGHKTPIESIPHLLAWVEEREHIIDPLNADGSRFNI